MSSRVIAVCNRCATEQEFKLAAGCTPEQWTNDLRLEGWWSISEDVDLCQECGPQPIGAEKSWARKELTDDTKCSHCGLMFHGAKGYCDWCGYGS